MDARLVIAGFVVGTIAGMSGIGGSSLLAPILILLFGVKASVAIGTDLLYSVPMKALAAFAHIRQRTIDWRVIRPLCAGGVPGALAGLAAFWFVRTHLPAGQLEQLLRHAIAIVILIASAAAVVTQFLQRKNAAPAEPRGAATIAIGGLVGFLVALTSIGSGSITLPLLLLVLPSFGLRRLIGSEIVFAAVMVPVAAAGHIAFANVDWAMAASLCIGALPGAYLGARLCARVGEWTLRPAIFGVLAFVALKLF